MLALPTYHSVFVLGLRSNYSRLFYVAMFPDWLLVARPIFVFIIVVFPVLIVSVDWIWWVCSFGQETQLPFVLDQLDFFSPITRSSLASYPSKSSSFVFRIRFSDIFHQIYAATPVDCFICVLFSFMINHATACYPLTVIVASEYIILMI